MSHAESRGSSDFNSCTALLIDRGMLQTAEVNEIAVKGGVAARHPALGRRQS
jgi:hypothetical protein